MLSLRTLGLALVLSSIALLANPLHAGGGTITDIVLESGGDFDEDRRDYDILLNAVVTADLAEALADPNAELTVFAPNDRAFVQLAKDLGYKGGYDEAAAWTFLGGSSSWKRNGCGARVLHSHPGLSHQLRGACAPDQTTSSGDLRALCSVLCSLPYTVDNLLFALCSLLLYS